MMSGRLHALTHASCDIHEDSDYRELGTISIASIPPRMTERSVVAGASEEEAPFVHSFHLDLHQNPQHRAMLEGVSAVLQKTLSRVSQHIAVWRSLDVLWMTDKAAAVEQLQVPFHDCTCKLAFRMLYSSTQDGSCEMGL